jgi:hypothetical protein
MDEPLIYQVELRVATTSQVVHDDPSQLGAEWEPVQQPGKPLVHQMNQLVKRCITCSFVLDDPCRTRCPARTACSSYSNRTTIKREVLIHDSTHLRATRSTIHHSHNSKDFQEYPHDTTQRCTSPTSLLWPLPPFSSPHLWPASAT